MCLTGELKVGVS